MSRYVHNTPDVANHREEFWSILGMAVRCAQSVSAHRVCTGNGTLFTRRTRTMLMLLADRLDCIVMVRARETFHGLFRPAKHWNLDRHNIEGRRKVFWEACSHSSFRDG
jgi:hypothetical protein